VQCSISVLKLWQFVPLGLQAELGGRVDRQIVKVGGAGGHPHCTFSFPAGNFWGVYCNQGDAQVIVENSHHGGVRTVGNVPGVRFAGDWVQMDRAALRCVAAWHASVV